MAYKLSLVTTDIRKRMAESVKEEKIHDKEKTYISTKEYKHKQQEKYNPHTNKKRYLTIDAVKKENKKLKVDAEIDKDVLDDESLGIIIDQKK